MKLKFNETRDRTKAKGIHVKHGSSQDASFIESDRGKYGNLRLCVFKVYSFYFLLQIQHLR